MTTDLGVEEQGGVLQAGKHKEEQFRLGKQHTRKDILMFGNA